MQLLLVLSPMGEVLVSELSAGEGETTGTLEVRVAELGGAAAVDAVGRFGLGRRTSRLCLAATDAIRRGRSACRRRWLFLWCFESVRCRTGRPRSRPRTWAAALEGHKAAAMRSRIRTRRAGTTGRRRRRDTRERSALAALFACFDAIRGRMAEGRNLGRHVGKPVASVSQAARVVSGTSRWNHFPTQILRRQKNRRSPKKVKAAVVV